MSKTTSEKLGRLLLVSLLAIGTPALVLAAPSGRLSFSESLRCFFDAVIPFAATPGYCAEGIETGKVELALAVPAEVEPVSLGVVAGASVGEGEAEALAVAVAPALSQTYGTSDGDTISWLTAKVEFLDSEVSRLQDRPSYSPASTRKWRRAEREDTGAEISAAVSGGETSFVAQGITVSGSTISLITEDIGAPSASWEATSALPNGATNGPMVVYLNGYIYRMGGEDASGGFPGDSVNAAYRAKVSADGTLGEWETAGT